MAGFFVTAYFCLQMLIPIGLLIWVAFQPYVQPPSLAALTQLSPVNFTEVPWGTVLKGLRNSLILMVAVPTLALMMCFKLLARGPHETLHRATSKTVVSGARESVGGSRSRQASRLTRLAEVMPHPFYRNFRT